MLLPSIITNTAPEPLTLSRYALVIRRPCNSGPVQQRIVKTGIQKLAGGHTNYGQLKASRRWHCAFVQDA